MSITKRITKGSSLTYQEMDDNIEAIAPRTSATGSVQIPAGTTAQRDGSPLAGYLRYNNQLNQFEGYTTSWGALAGGGGGGGEVNQNAFSNFAVSGQTTIAADGATDTLNIIAGSGIGLTTNASTDSLTISASFSQDFAFSSLTGTPTTVSGYGITDAQALLVSGTNIKTINNVSVLGSGNMSITATSDWLTLANKPTTISGFGITDAFDGAFSSLTGKPTTVSGYGITDAQAILVSATNIKTINGVSVLGSGDLTVAGSYGDTQVSSHLNTLSANTNEFLQWNGTDFQWASVGGGGGGSETDPVVGAIDGIVKSDGSGNISQAIAGTDYSEFDGNFSSLQNVPITLAGAGISNASLLELGDVSGGGGSNNQVLTSDGNGTFTFQDVSGGGGGGGATSWTGLSDTPNNYVGAQNQVITVNSQATGLTFTTLNAGAESNDLSSVVTWTTVPDAYISNTSIVQHQADIRITESQITDLQSYITTETDPVFLASPVGNVAITNTEGFLKNIGGEWFYDTNTYVTSAGAESDPIFTAHTTYDIIEGTGLLGNNGAANTWYYDSNTYIQGSDVPDNETDPVFSAATVANISDGSGFLVNDGSGNWYYDANAYVTSTGAESDPVFTAHTTYNINNGTGRLVNDGGGNWSYEANTFIEEELDPVFDAHTVSDIIDGEGFLRQNSNNDWYWDANTYVTANDIPASTATLDEVTTNGSSTTNSIEVGGATVSGTNVMLEGGNNALLSNGSAFITLQDLSAGGDLVYDNTTGQFSANTQSTGIALTDLTANTYHLGTGNGAIEYDSATGNFQFIPPDFSPYVNSGQTESDPIFTASPVGNVVAAGAGTDGFLRNVGGEWYYDANVYSTSSGGGGGATTLGALTDVDTSGVADGSLIQYDGTSTDWEISSSATVVADGIGTAGAGADQILSWDGGAFAWIDQTALTVDALSVTTNAASASPALSYANGVFEYTPPEIPSLSSVTLQTATDNGATTNNAITVPEITATEGIFAQGDQANSHGGKITLNSAQTGTPASTNTNWSYIEVERGTSLNTAIRWNEGNNVWQLTNDGSNYADITTGAHPTFTTPSFNDVMGVGDASSRPLTLFRTTDGDLGQGTLRFESRDQTPTAGQSIGDIRFFGDNDTNSGTYTETEFGRISASSQRNDGFAYGQINFSIPVNNVFYDYISIGDDPTANTGSDPTITRYSTHFKEPVFFRAGNNRPLRLYDETSDLNDITSDAGIYMKMSAIDEEGNMQDRVEIDHQNNFMRILVRDNNNQTIRNQLTIRPNMAFGGMQLSHTDSGSTTTDYQVTTEYNIVAHVAANATYLSNPFRFHRVTTTERDAISLASAGFMIYNTTTDRVEVYDGSNWGAVDATPSIDDQGDATAITIDSNENVGVGTSNPVAKFAVGTAGKRLELDTGVIRGFNRTGGSWDTIDFEASDYIFDCSATEKVRIDSDGLKFNGDTAAANALSDYETGGWDPTFSASGYTFQYNATTQGRYVKIGNLVHINGYIRLSQAPTGSGSVALNIAGLPFNVSNANNSSYTAGSMIVEASGATFVGIPTPRLNRNSTTFYILQNREGQSPLYGSINVAGLTTSMEFEFQFTYHTDA